MEPTKKRQEKEGNSREKLYLIIILLLLIGYVPMIWQMIDKGSENQTLIVDNNNLEAEKNNVLNDLSLLQADFGNLETNNLEMQTRIDSQQVKIAALRLELESASGDKAHLQRVIAKLKKETETLRTIMQGFVVKIDSLNTLNQHLTAELGETKTQLTDATENISNLSSERQDLQAKVEVGAMLETENMVSNAVRIRSGGGYKETNRAKNAEQIKTCFDVRENKLTKPGEKIYYIRVIKPDGSVLTPPARDTHFEWKAGSGFYTVKKAEKYSNAATDLCVFFEIEGEVPEGKYLTEVYVDGFMIGKTYFELK